MNTLYNRLKSVLEEFLKDRQPEIEPSPSDTFPLFLILTAKPDLVAFSTLDGHPEENFSKAFQNFKDLYSIHSSDWADFDLTLVLCKTDKEKIEDEFCNKIEVDPYFCRKFVIDLSKDLKKEFGRLPFIPLHPESIVGFRRPISAQTFLIKHGVNHELAKSIVVPHYKAEKRIIKDGLKGNLGKPVWHEIEVEELISFSYTDKPEDKPKARLKELEINNFRAYSGNYKFDLDADLVILYGPNGFGKTSLFDAIDFVCTGGVARFDERFGRKVDRLKNALKHLDSLENDSFVKAAVSTNGGERVIERYIKDRTKTYIDGATKNRRETLKILTGLLEELPDLRIENFVRLFRATHLFGQEYQSLTSEFRHDSMLPKNIVSRMLAFEDYVEAIKKTRSVSGALKKQAKDKESEIAFLRSFLKAKEDEMDQLRKMVKITEKPETVLALGKSIAERIAHEIKLQIAIPEEFSQEVVRNWRAMVEVKTSSVKQNLEIIEELEIKFPELEVHRRKLKKKLSELTQKNELLNQINENYSGKKKDLEESNETLKKTLYEERSLSLGKENMNWLLQAKIGYKQLKEHITKEDKNYRDIQAQLLELLPKIEELNSEIQIIDENVNRITLEINALRSSLEDLTNLKKSIIDWQKTTHRQKELESLLSNIEQRIINIKTELRSKGDELNTATITLDKLKKYADNLRKSQSELQVLLSNIEKHIFDNICPVCGTLHRSREELIERLKHQRGVQPKQIQETMKSFEDARLKVDDSNKQVDYLELKLKQSGQEVEATQKELIDVEGKIKTYEEVAISLNIPITFENLEAVIDSRIKDRFTQIEATQQALYEQQSKMKDYQDKLTSFAKQKTVFEHDSRVMESKYNQLKSMIENIRSEAEKRQVSLEVEKETVQTDLANTNNILEGLRRQVQMQQTEYQNLQNEVNNLVEKKSILDREIQEIGKEILDSKKYVEVAEGLIKKLDLELDIGINQILLIKKERTEELSHLDSLRNEITNFEIALDATQISASLATIQQDIENVKKKISNLEKDYDGLKDWLSYFDKICEKLESIQNQALKEYTDKYGPLTSTIQKRLRPVYGFEDMRLYPEKDAIAVRVERKEEKDIHPSDFFSESQIQIVMLSLFSSAALTQTWSSFAPILLDDPVEHFDDLNAYSFLDLIRGLIMESAKGYQFIISTCEDRLFRLMQQKFSKLSGRAIFYVFESIGEKGPMIRRL